MLENGIDFEKNFQNSQNVEKSWNCELRYPKNMIIGGVLKKIVTTRAKKFFGEFDKSQLKVDVGDFLRI